MTRKLLVGVLAWPVKIGGRNDSGQADDPAPPRLVPTGTPVRVIDVSTTHDCSKVRLADGTVFVAPNGFLSDSEEN